MLSFRLTKKTSKNVADTTFKNNNLSIKLIKAKNKSQTFRFKETNIDEIKMSIQNLDPKKASQKSDMNTRFLRKNISAMISLPLFTPQSFTLN